jgi:hypothetical protein
MRKCFVPYPILKKPWRRSRHTNRQKKQSIILYKYIPNYPLDTRKDLLWCGGEAAVRRVWE